MVESPAIRQLNIAQLGCGYWGPNLLRNFANAENCDVKLVVEESLERRTFIGENYPEVAVASDWHEALDNPEIDALVIATPAASHFDLSIQALQAGKHLFVEKPLAMTAAEVDELGTLADSNDLTLMVGHTFLYNPAIVRAKEIVQSGELGNVLYMYSKRLALGQVRNDVNAWWTLAPHDLSILIYLMGDLMPNKITATGGSYLNPGLDDVVFSTLEWENGVKASIHVSWIDPGRDRSMAVVGDKKMLTFDDIAEERLKIHDRRVDIDRSGARPILSYHNNVAVDVPVADDEPLSVEVAHFIDCILTGDKPLTGHRHARDIVALLEAGQQSLDTGHPVALSSIR
jgi:predicted dehydrogenase